MRTILIFLFVFVLFVTLWAQEIPDSRNREIVIQSVNVIPMDKEEILENQMVVIRDGRIAAIGKNLKHDKNALVINARGKYLMPGLAEMHAHVPPVDDLEPMKEVLFLFASHGITTIRGMLGHPRHLELREKLQKKEILGPRFYTTGPSFNGMSVTSPSAGADMVRKQKEAGYDYLKLHPGLTREKFDSIAATAHRAGIPFVGHVSFGVGVWRAIEANYSSIDHLDGFIEGLVHGIDKMIEQQAGPFGMFVADQADTKRIPELMTALETNGIWVVPTQSLAERWFSPTYEAEQFKREPEAKYMNPETVNQWVQNKKNLQSNPQYEAAKISRFVELRRKLIYECQKAGVGLLLGCDAPQVFNVPGISTHHELQYLVGCGLTPYQALKTGTVNVGTYLGREDLGKVRTGALADLILIEANPLTDIQATKKIAGVMMDGKWLSAEYIASELKKLEKK